MPDLRDRLAQAITYERGGVLDKALEVYRDIGEEASDPAIRAEALRREADVHRIRCAWPAALGAARASAAVAQQAGLEELYAEALNAEAIVHQTQGDFDSALPLLEQMLELTGDDRIRGLAWQNMGYIAATQGRLDEAERHFSDSVESFRRAGYERGEVISLVNQTQAALDRGEAERAIHFGEQAVLAARRIGDLEMVANGMVNLSEALALLGELDLAAERVSAALGHFLAIENRFKQVECLRRLGEIHTMRGDDEVAERCYRQGRDIAREIGARVEAELLAQKVEDLEEA